MFEQRYIYLFIVLLLPFFLHPLIATPKVGVAIMDCSFALILVVALFAVSARRRVRYVALGLMVLAQVLLWTDDYVPSLIYRLLSVGVSCAYLLYTTIFLLDRILKRRDVTISTIFASLCVYLLIGYIWSFLFSILEVSSPGSFAVNKSILQVPTGPDSIYVQLYYFIYYSFTTLTTLGLGDILPSSPWARVLTAIEAIIGQIYLVVLVSRLVGMHISQRREDV